MSCHVVTNRHGRLALRLNWQGRRSWEGTGLADTPENRRRVEALAELVNAELRAGIFDARRYLHYFPGGTRAAEVRPPTASGSAAGADPEPNVPTVREHFKDWIARQVPPAVRPAQRRDVTRSSVWR